MNKTTSSRYITYGTLAVVTTLLLLIMMNGGGEVSSKSSGNDADASTMERSPMPEMQTQSVAQPHQGLKRADQTAAAGVGESPLENSEQPPIQSSPAAFVEPEPTSDQIVLYEAFKQEAQTYVMDENFDLNRFMSDPRLAEMHASQSNELIEKVMIGLENIQLKQDKR